MSYQRWNATSEAFAAKGKGLETRSGGQDAVRRDHGVSWSRNRSRASAYENGSGAVRTDSSLSA